MAALMLAATALAIFGGAALLPTSLPLPQLAYPVLVATMLGRIRAHWQGLGQPATA